MSLNMNDLARRGAVLLYADSVRTQQELRATFGAEVAAEALSLLNGEKMARARQARTAPARKRKPRVSATEMDAKIVSFLQTNGPSGPSAVIKGIGMTPSTFYRLAKRNPLITQMRNADHTVTYSATPQAEAN